MKLAKIYYPWLSIFLGLLLVGWFLISGQTSLVQFYQIPGEWLVFELQLVIVVIYFVLLLVETLWFLSSKRLLQNQVSTLWQSKKKLQSKASIYSGHADKLKLFISDKLLEYIEYDEKFLHFKNIASEVRHNGVISYDKVKMALNLAMEREAEWQKDARIARDAANLTPNQATFHDAIQSMRYLWDLLDLSTTDNIALHLSNHLAECEEHYYQSKLNADTSDMPFIPDFSPRLAVLQTLNELMHLDIDQQHDETFDDLIVEDEGRIYANLQPTEKMLGNPNHLILLLENLLKNAQFFTGKSKAIKKYQPIRLTMSEQKGQIDIRVYNLGRHIDEEYKDRIYQLGFSSRRTKEHHGKGLGLFFVKQIVSGYEGKIQFTNVENRAVNYHIRVTLANDEVVEMPISVVINEREKPQCLHPDTNDLVKQIGWSFKHPVVQVQIQAEGQLYPDKFSDFPDSGSCTRFQPYPDYAPQWVLEINSKRGSKNLTFIPIDINGVMFHVRLPTAETYVDGGVVDEESQEVFEHDVERLAVPFQQKYQPDV